MGWSWRGWPVEDIAVVVRVIVVVPTGVMMGGGMVATGALVAPQPAA